MGNLFLQYLICLCENSHRVTFKYLNMFIESINWWILVSASVAGLSVGALWYSPMVFGKQWGLLTGLKSENSVLQWRSIALMFVVILTLSLGLEYLIFTLELVDIGGAVGIASMVWATIALPTMVTSTIFEKESWKLLLLNSLYQLATMVIISLILVHYS